MGKFRYVEGGASGLVEGVEKTGDPLLKAAAAVINEVTELFEKIDKFITNHGNEFLRGELMPLSRSNYNALYRDDEPGREDPSLPEEAAFLYDAAKRLDRKSDELIKLIEARVPDLPWLKKEG